MRGRMVPVAPACQSCRDLAHRHGAKSSNRPWHGGSVEKLENNSADLASRKHTGVGEAPGLGCAASALPQSTQDQFQLPSVARCQPRRRVNRLAQAVFAAPRKISGNRPALDLPLWATDTRECPPSGRPRIKRLPAPPPNWPSRATRRAVSSPRSRVRSGWVDGRVDGAVAWMPG